MRIVADAHERKRLYRTVGLVLLLAAPGLAFGSWYSTRQPLEFLAVTERMKDSVPLEVYSSAVYHGSHAQATLDNKWKPTGFATLGTTGFLLGVGLLAAALRGPQRRSGTGSQGSTARDMSS
ncbi:MAG TPA: hypothetical protein VFO55_09310 [Gemmatimonadaceae bacterium]|nr:hypothetical protein [Gemmatimonadaceae bacterium]